jgi:hypothetical protein
MAAEALFLRKIARYELGIFTKIVNCLLSVNFFTIFFPYFRSDAFNFMRGTTITCYQDYFVYYRKRYLIVKGGRREILNSKDDIKIVFKGILKQDYQYFVYNEIFEKMKDGKRIYLADKFNVFYNDDNFYLNEEIISEENLIIKTLEDVWRYRLTFPMRESYVEIE